MPRIRRLLSAVIIVGGVMVLADAALESGISTTFVGAVVTVVGLFEIIHAVWMRGWGGLGWQTLLGLLYVAVGLVLVVGAGSGGMISASGIARSARSGELLLTYGLGLLLVLSGIVRVLLGWSRWRDRGWMMILSGSFGVVAGLIVVAEFPKMGLWLFGLVLGIDLILHGAAWLGFPYQWGRGP